MSTGGQNDDYSLLNEVQWFDERLMQWHPLPPMTRKRSWHGLLSTERGKIIAAGGERVSAKDSSAQQSLESLQISDL